jgi:hypothetical protein
MGTAQQELELSALTGVPNAKRNGGSPTAQDKLRAICVWLDNKIPIASCLFGFDAQV